MCLPKKQKNLEKLGRIVLVEQLGEGREVRSRVSLGYSMPSIAEQEG